MEAPSTRGRGAPLVVAAPDSFKGCCPATSIAEAVATAADHAGWECDLCPMSDGGEGFAEIVASSSSSGGGNWVSDVVTGPLGSPVEASWWWDPPEAVAEAASASGLVLAGGPEHNDPLAATSRGTGELIAAAIARGASRILLGLGGSATTDGGIGAVDALLEAGGLRGAELLVACDVSTTFVDAAPMFSPQKGATGAQVAELSRRLGRILRDYEERFGLDVGRLPGSGAAGGLGGGLAAVGGRLARGFDLVSERVRLRGRIAAADLVVTGEGTLDPGSWEGKVVGGVAKEAQSLGVGVLVVAGAVADKGVAGVEHLEVTSLSERFGRERSLTETAACVTEVVREHLVRLAAAPTQQGAG
jgi:glycerate kinase